MARIEFDPENQAGKQAIVVSFDLCGFSEFCNHADAYSTLHRFLGRLFDELNTYFLSWADTWLGGLDFKKNKLRPPDFVKFTGDGALMIWFLPEEAKRRRAYCTAVVRAMHTFRDHLKQVIPLWGKEWQVHALPNRARFGIAVGLVYPLLEKLESNIIASTVDYVGYCINLACRLQNHFRDIDFLVHERVQPEIEGLIEFIAVGMKGVKQEVVLLFESDFPSVKLEALEMKFKPTGTLPIEQPKALLNLKDGQVVQPRFEALLMGPGYNQIILLDSDYPEFLPLRDVHDTSGKVIGREVMHFELRSKGPPLVYVCTRTEPFQSSVRH